MKKSVIIFMIVSILILAAGCNTDSNSHNPDYTYGKYDETIEAIYELTGDISYYPITDYSNWSDYGHSESYLLKVSETAGGGVIAFCEGIYVFSTDKSNADGVKRELIKELSSEQD